jgi:hypothetical protein
LITPQRSQCDFLQLVRGYRLLQISVSAKLARLLFDFDAAVASDENEGSVGLVLVNPLQQFQAIRPRHPEIRNDQVNAVTRQSANRAISIRCCRYLPFIGRQDAPPTFSDALYVVHEQDLLSM